MMKHKDSVTLLVVDDEQVHRYMLCSMFAEWGWQSQEADDGTSAVAAVKQCSFDAILMDVRMTMMDGMEALKQIQAINPAIPVIIMTAYSSVDAAVEAIKIGAHDYLTKPLDFDRLHRSIEAALGHRHRVDTNRSQITTNEMIIAERRMIGKSASIIALQEIVIKVAPTTANVLITGESGTGKELVAEALHDNSNQNKGPLVKVNCAALAETLLESELFGHEKGAFTGADKQREGKFVQAQNGTLFLDEIGETSPAMQVKLLRVLQEHELERVGGRKTIQVNARVIAATNRNLEDEIKAGRFREDLYYRLNVVVLEIPPLRKRDGDIPLLTNYFVEKYAKDNNRNIEGVTPEYMDILNRYPWPGNVRELENAVERGVILMRGDYLDVQSLPLAIERWNSDSPKTNSDKPATLKEAEKLLIIQTLKETGGNKSEAARRLQISRKTLSNKLHGYGLAE